MRVLHLDAPSLHRAEAVAESGARLRLVVLLRLGLVQERAHPCAVSDWVDRVSVSQADLWTMNGLFYKLNCPTLVFANFQNVFLGGISIKYTFCCIINRGVEVIPSIA